MVEKIWEKTEEKDWESCWLKTRDKNGSWNECSIFSIKGSSIKL